MNLRTIPPLEVLQAFEQVPDLYLILSPELQVLTASDAYLNFCCSVREDIVGKQLSEVFPGKAAIPTDGTLPELTLSLQQVLATKKAQGLALQLCIPPYS